MRRTRAPKQMRRTKFNDDLSYLNLVRKLSHSYSRSTGIPYEDLYSEGCEAYIRGIRGYVNCIDVAKITYLYRTISNALIDYCKKETNQRILPYGISEWVQETYEPLFNVEMDPVEYSEDIELVLDMIWEWPLRYLPDQDPSKLRLNFRKCIGTIGRDLKAKRGWNPIRVARVMRELRTTFINQFDGN